jgi:hypothetical protein
MDGHLRAISHVVTPVERIDAVPDDEDDKRFWSARSLQGLMSLFLETPISFGSTPSGTSRFGGRRISSRHSKLAR